VWVTDLGGRLGDEHDEQLGCDLVKNGWVACGSEVVEGGGGGGADFGCFAFTTATFATNKQY
jgi:hypothetical protein